MRIEYDLSKEDYVEFQLYHFKKSKDNKIMVFRRSIIHPSWIFLLLLIFYALSGLPVIISFISIIPFYTLSILLYPKYYLHKLRANLCKAYLKSSDSYCKNEVIISEGNLYCKDELCEVKWLSFKTIEETTNLILIYLNITSAIIIPKRAFLNDEERKKFQMELTAIH